MKSAKLVGQGRTVCAGSLVRAIASVRWNLEAENTYKEVSIEIRVLQHAARGASRDGRRCLDS